MPDEQIPQIRAETPLDRYAHWRASIPVLRWLDEHPEIAGAMGIASATLLGPAKGEIEAAAPPLARYLDRLPARIMVNKEKLPPFVYGSTRWGPGAAAKAGASYQNPPAGMVVNLRGSPVPVGPNFPSGTTPIHEGLHAAYVAKGLSGFPPEEHMPALLGAANARIAQQAAAGKPTFLSSVGGGSGGAARERVIEWMAENVRDAMRRRGLQGGLQVAQPAQMQLLQGPNQ